MTVEAPRWLDYMAVEDLVARFDPRNPKGHDLDELRASLGRFGYTEPILLDERTGRLVAGHGRVELLAAEMALGAHPPEGVTIDGDGRWLAPVNRGWSSRDDSEAGAYLVASNRLTERGGWLERPLADLLSDLASTGAGLEGVGFDDAELGALLDSLAEPAPPDEFPPVDDDLPTEHRCPRCGYEWSGGT